MAAGAWTVYNLAKKKIGNGTLSLASTVFRCTLHTSASNAQTATLGVYASLTGEVTSVASSYSSSGKALANDPFWAVRAESAAALGEQRTPRALAILVSAVGDAHPRVRRAVASALGRFRNATAADALTAWIERGDASYLVEAETRRALGRTRDPRAHAILAGRFASDPVSWNECVLAACIDGLGALRDARGIPTLPSSATRATATSSPLACATCVSRRSGTAATTTRR